jgi:hypothetical protein
MMKKPIQKLLAVAIAMGASTASAAPRTLANGAPAPGNTVAKGETYSYKRETPKERARTELAAARNALTAAFAEEREAVAMIVARPRTLASGAPACGNVNEKPTYAECTDAIADQYVSARIERVKRAGDLVASARTRVATAEKVLAVYEARDARDASRTAATPPSSVPVLALAIEVVR